MNNFEKAAIVHGVLNASIGEIEAIAQKFWDVRKGIDLDYRDESYSSPGLQTALDSMRYRAINLRELADRLEAYSDRVKVQQPG